MKILTPTLNNLNEIMLIIHDAQNWFKENNIDQWQNNYPNKDTILNDMNNHEAYILVNDDDIIAYFALSFRGEITYNHIYDGSWSNNHDYAVIHRIVISNKYKGQGISKVLFKMIEDIISKHDIDTIRIDTHIDNYVMKNLLLKLNYKYTGIIYLLDNDSRIAFDKVII